MVEPQSRIEPIASPCPCAGYSRRDGSVLDEIIEDCLQLDRQARPERRLDCSTRSQGICAEVKSFAATTAMFMPGAAGVAASALLGMLDHMSCVKKTETQLPDGLLGAMSGAASNVNARFFSHSRLSLPVQGLSTSICQRLIDDTLNSRNYVDPKSRQFSLARGLSTAAAHTLNADVLLSDWLTCTASTRLLESLKPRVAGALSNSPHVRRAMVGLVFGLNSGAGQEIVREHENHEAPDLNRIASRSLTSAVEGSLAAALGGSFERIGLSVRPACAAENAGLLPWSQEAIRRLKLSRFCGMDHSIQVNGETSPPLIQMITHPVWNVGADYPAGNLALVRQSKTQFGWQDKSARALLESRRIGMLDLIGGLDGPGLRRYCEDSACRLEKRAQENNIPCRQIEHCYKDLGQLLSENTDSADRSKRLILAEQLLDQAANPRLVFQKGWETCMSAAIEFRLLTRSPYHPVAVVTQVARTGRFITGDGTTVKLSPASLNVDFRALMPYEQEYRSYASQLFQTTVPNIYWQRRSMYVDFRDNGITTSRAVPRGAIRYEISPQTSKQQAVERLMDYSYDPPRLIIEKPGLPSDAPELVCAQITGRIEPWFSVPFMVRSEAEMHEILRDRKQCGAFPLIMTVHTSNPPFMTGSSRQAGVKGGWHAVSITDFDEKSGIVGFFNTWGTRMHGDTMKLHELAAASAPSNARRDTNHAAPL